ncbi:MAG: MarR family transcriptional regulator [Oligoflexus sp.]|jgi:DNA-binding MarR family transcriptional regulator|nr:MarR family transcriptional regulator [Pseudopedobacter sp.]
MKIEEELKHEFVSPQQRAFTNIIFTSNWVLNKIAVALKPTGLSLQQFNALSILDGQPNKTAFVNLIKDRLIDRMPNVSRLLNKLMEKGLIEKQRDTSDQRVVYIKITQNGINAKKAAREMINGVVIDLTSEQSDLLNNLLEKVRA